MLPVSPLDFRFTSQQAWIAYRQDHSQVPWDDILASGFDAVACTCGKQGCLGWRLAKVSPPPLPRYSLAVTQPPQPPRAA